MSVSLDPDNEAELCARLFMILKKLKANWKENAILYNQIKLFIQERGAGDADEIESLAETLNMVC